MRAVQVTALGGPEQLTPTDLPDPVVGPGEVLVRTGAAGVNFPDGLIVAGSYQTRHEPPFVPGCEVAGVVEAVGPGVELAPGTRVTAFCRMGGYAELVTVPTTMVFPIPDSLDDVTAAAIPVAYGTSYHGLIDRAAIRPGETVLVLGASGGVGLTAVQIAHRSGARVIAAASDPQKLALAAEHGAEVLIDYRADDLAAAVREHTGGAGADVVYDPVGGDLAVAALKSLTWHGRFLTVGYASGDIPRVGLNRLLLQEASVLGVLWGAWAGREPQANAANLDVVLGWCGAGEIRPHIGGTHPLDEAARALTTVMNRQALGKIVLTTGGPR